MSDKSLLEQWREMAYDQKKTREQLKSLWDAYFLRSEERRVGKECG